MTAFKREFRYFVAKIKDINDALSTDEFNTLCYLMEKIDEYRKSHGKNELNCVVIEDDWKCYEKAWELVEQECAQ